MIWYKFPMFRKPVYEFIPEKNALLIKKRGIGEHINLTEIISGSRENTQKRNSQAKRVDFEAGHPFIDHCIVRRISDRRNRLFLFEDLLRFEIKLGAFVHINDLNRFLNQIVKGLIAPLREIETIAPCVRIQNLKRFIRIRDITPPADQQYIVLTTDCTFNVLSLFIGYNFRLNADLFPV